MTEHAYQHSGGCACGAVTFTYHSDQPMAALCARACQCEFCLPRGNSYLSFPGDRLEVRVRDSRFLYAHVFATATAEFMHCGLCNHLVYVRSEIDGRDYGLVVAQALSEWQGAAQEQPVDHGNESAGDRLARRAANWIADFVVEEYAE